MKDSKGNVLLKTIAALGALLLALLVLNSVHEASGTPALFQAHDVIIPTLVETVNVGEWDPPSPEPAGIAYLPSQQRLLISDSELPGMEGFESANLFLADLQGNLLQTFDTTSFASNVTGVGLNLNNGHLFLSDVESHRIYEVADPWGDPRLVTSLNTRAFGSGDPQDVAYDSVNDLLIMIDGRDREVHLIDPGPDDLFDNDDAAISFEVSGLGMTEPHGITYDAHTDHLLIVDSDSGLIVEVDKDGNLIREIDATSTGLENPAGVAMLPADGEMRTLLLVDRGLFNDPGGGDGGDDDDDDGDDDDLMEDAEDGGLLYTFQLPAYGSGDPTATPPSTPGTTPTPTPDGTGTPSPSPTPDVDPRANIAYLPIVKVQQLHNNLGEPNDFCPEAYPLLANRPYTFMPDDQDDWYHFTLFESVNVTIRLSNFAPLAGQVAAYQGQSCDGATFIQNVGQEGTEKTLDIGQQAAGRYYIYLSNDGPLMADQAYTLVVEAR